MSEKDKPTVLLEYYLKKLRLPTMLREYASMATICQEHRSDFPTYLLRLIERELLDREKRAIQDKQIKPLQLFLQSLQSSFLPTFQ